MLHIWNFFLDRPRFTWLVVAAIVFGGLVSVLSMPKEATPEVKVPIGVVATVYPGASALDVERLITDKIEDKIANLDDVDEYTSSSQDGISSVVVQFEASADITDRIRALRDAVETARPSLPSDANDPVVTEVSFSDLPIAVFSVSADVPEPELKRIAEDMQDRLEQIKGVSQVSLAGAREAELQVQTDKSRLEQHGVSLPSLLSAISTGNATLPVGTIETDQVRYAIRFDAEVTDPEDIASLPIETNNGIPLYVRDVADVSFTLAKASTLSRNSVGGEPSANAISLSVFKKTGGDIVGIVDQARMILDDVQSDYPEARVFVSLDNSEEVSKSLGSLLNNGFTTMIIIFLLLYMFLGWREALVAGLSLPLTFLFGFIGLSLVGETINFLSLFSLILALGILVDTGIVVTEGMHDHLNAGKTPKQAAADTIKEFQWPLISGTLTTVAAFLPLMFMSGILGSFVRHIPLTIVFVLMGSLFTALALLPTIGSVILRNQHKSGGHKKETFADRYFRPYINKLEAAYEKQLRAFLPSRKRRRFMTIGLVVGFVLSMSLPAVGLVKVIMFPDANIDTFSISVKAPIGTSLNMTDAAVRQVEEELYKDPVVKSFVSIVGSGNSQQDITSGASGNSSNVAGITVNLYEERGETTTEIVARYRDVFAMIQDAEVTITQEANGPPTGAPVSITFTGPDLDVLQGLMSESETILLGITGATQVQTSQDEAPLQFVIRPRREEAGRYGLTPVQLAQVLRTAVQGTEASKVRYQGDDISVRVTMQLNPAATSDAERTVTSIDEIRHMTIATPAGEVSLDSLADITPEASTNAVQHLDGKRRVGVTAYNEGRTSAEIFADFEAQAKTALTIPDGYTMTLGGEAEDIEQSFQDLFRALFLGLFLIAAILLLQFNSYRQPIFIMITLPLALIAVFPGLMVTGQPLSFPAFIGIIALSGVVVNDAIVMIDRINVNRRNGAPMFEALVNAGVSRMQPIILTTVTTVAGILPLAISDPSWGPLGFSVIFGLSFATLLTLFVIPMLYQRFGEKAGKSA